MKQIQRRGMITLKNLQQAVKKLIIAWMIIISLCMPYTNI